MKEQIYVTSFSLDYVVHCIGLCQMKSASKSYGQADTLLGFLGPLRTHIYLSESMGIEEHQ